MQLGWEEATRRGKRQASDKRRQNSFDVRCRGNLQAVRTKSGVRLIRKYLKRTGDLRKRSVSQAAEMKPSQKLLKAGIGAQGVGNRLHRQVNHAVVVLVGGSVQIPKGIVLFA